VIRRGSSQNGRLDQVGVNSPSQVNANSEALLAAFAIPVKFAPFCHTASELTADLTDGDGMFTYDFKL
jgi:hypothetical protein